MNKRIILLVIASLLLVSTVLLVHTYKVTAERLADASFNQVKSRIIVTKTHDKPPVKIVMVKAKGRQVETDKEFLDDDDWLRGLTIRVTNNSGKPITFLNLELAFMRTTNQAGIPGAWPLRRGVDPFSSDAANSNNLPQIELATAGQDLELLLSDGQYDEIKQFLHEIDFRESVKRIEIQVVAIGFSDGTAWNGRMYRRDPANINGPLKGWSPIEETGREGTQLNQTGTPKIGRPFFRSHVNAGKLEFFKTGWTATPRTTGIKSG